MRNRKVAIVSTIRDAAETIPDWIRYHLAIGFDRIILFLDDPAEIYVEISQMPEVIIVKNDSALHERWKKGRLYRAHRKFIDDHVMSRQLLNAEVGIEIARSENIDWILHLDSDELFYCNDTTLQGHIETLEENKQRVQTYINYESVVEHFEIEDVFRTVTLFKKNSKLLTADQLSVLAKITEQDTKKIFGFFAYGNGKSMGKVSRNLVPVNVHNFGMSLTFDLLLGLFSAIFRRKKTAEVFAMPVILHYPSCGFSMFWNKYKVLGNFPDLWFGKDPIKDRIPFHLEARNMLLEEDLDQIKAFYRQKVVCEDGEAKTDLVNAGVYCRVSAPADLIGSLRKRNDVG